MHAPLPGGLSAHGRRLKGSGSPLPSAELVEPEGTSSKALPRMNLAVIRSAGLAFGAPSFRNLGCRKNRLGTTGIAVC